MLQNFSVREGPPPYRFKRAKICVFAEKGLKMDLNVPKIILIEKVSYYPHYLTLVNIIHVI